MYTQIVVVVAAAAVLVPFAIARSLAGGFRPN